MKKLIFVLMLFLLIPFIYSYGEIVDKEETQNDENVIDYGAGVNTYYATKFNATQNYDTANVSLFLRYVAGSPTGLITVNIYDDNSGSPNNKLGTSISTIDKSILTGYLLWYEVDLNQTVSLVQGNTYWIGTYSDTFSTVNYMSWGMKTISGYGVYNSGDGVSWSVQYPTNTQNFRIYNTTKPISIKNINVTFPEDNIYIENYSQLVYFNITEMTPQLCELYSNDTGNFEVKDFITINGTYNITEFVNTSIAINNLTNVVAWYRAEENTGTNLSDSSGNNLHGSLVAGANFANSSGVRQTGNYSSNYDGTNDYADIGTWENFKTVSMWIYNNERIGYDYYFAHNNVRLYAHTTTGKINLGDSVGGNLDSTFDMDLNLNTWVHVVAISDGANSEIYINNVSKATGTLETKASGNVNLGRWIVGAHYLNGRIDEVIIFNNSISPQKVSELYENGLAKFNLTSVENITSYNLTINATQIQNLTWDFISNTYKVSDYYITCFDDVENISSKTQTLTYKSDLTLPVINILTPSYNESLNDTIHINWTTSEFTSCYINNTNFSLVTSNTTFYSYQETLIDNGFYSVDISCMDLAFNNATEEISFTKDTLLPSITWTYPNNLDSSKSVINSTSTLIVSGTDVNLFAYECLIYDVNSILKFNFSQENINPPTYSVQENFIPDKLGNWTADCTFSDSHTKQKIIQPKNNIDLDSKKITFEKIIENKKSSKVKKIKENITIEYKGNYILKDIKTKAKEDRTNFIFEYDLSGYNAPTIEHSYTIQCTDIYYISEEISGYKAHFVCYDTMTWIDFENNDIISYEVYEVSPNTWKIDTISNTNEVVEFESIGGLNFNNEIHLFEVVNEIAEEDDFKLTSFDLSKIGNVILLFIIAFLYIGCAVIGFMFGNKGFLSLAFFLGLFIGFILFSVHWVATSMFWLINISIFLIGARK